MDNKNKYIDLTGQKFGLLTVIDRNHSFDTIHSMWNCICDCTKPFVTRGEKLRSGRSKSCGCIEKERRYTDIVGMRFNMLTVIELDTSKKEVTWICKCDCGNTKPVRTGLLNNNSVRSCGCALKKNKPHRQRIYRIWSGMKIRCYSNTCKSFADYGAKGITICDEWKESFECFYEWAISHGYEEHLTIEREINSKNYTPENCSWATKYSQAQNTSYSLGVKKVLEIRELIKQGLQSSAIAKMYGVDRSSIKNIRTRKTYDNIP